MTTYNWDLIERLLHEVQNGAGHSFTPAALRRAVCGGKKPTRASHLRTWIT